MSKMVAQKVRAVHVLVEDRQLAAQWPPTLPKSSREQMPTIMLQLDSNSKTQLVSYIWLQLKTTLESVLGNPS